MIPWCIHVYSIFFVGTSTTPANATLQPSITPVQSQGRLRPCLHGVGDPGLVG